MGRELKILIRNCLITSFVIFIICIITWDPVVLFGVFGGSLISLLCLYLVIQDAEVAIRSSKPARITAIGYGKRYLIYGVLLYVMAYFFGFSGIVLSGLGLLTVKFNILLFGVKGIFNKLRHK